MGPSARAQDQIFDAASGGDLQVSGNLDVDSFSFTHRYPDNSQASGGLFLPNASVFLTLGGPATFGNVTISGNTSSIGDVTAGNLFTEASYFGGILFQDNNDHLSGSAQFDAMSFGQGSGQLNFGANGILTLTDNSTGNRLVLNPADFTIRLSGRNSGVVSLVGSAPAATRYSSTNLTLDFSDAALPFIQLFSESGAAQLTGNASAATLNFSQLNGGGITVSPTGQTISFSNGFVLSGNSSATPFGARSVALGDGADVSGGGAVAIGGATANGNLAVALGNGSYASADGALALSGGSASGGNALAIGYNSAATATRATTLGQATSASNWGVVVVGYNNQEITGNATAWSPGDPAFIVGDGAVNGPAGNALIIYNNGNLSFDGPLNLTDSSKELRINGPVILNGQATFSGNVLLSQPQGDISMGIYSH